MPGRDRIHPPVLLAALLALSFLAGCANYQLGDSAPPPFRTLYIKPADNDSFAPLAVARISAGIREAIIRDGRVDLLAKEEDAEAVLSVKLTDYRRTAVTRDSSDTVRARDFNIHLKAELTLYDQRTGDFYFRDRPVSANTSAYVGNPYGGGGAAGSDYQQAENMAMPRLARDIARKTIDTVLGNW